jgi:hypothetical protein
MARKRTLKDAAVDPRVEKNKVVSDTGALVLEEAKTTNAGKKKTTATRKRSLRDAAADQLVEKNKAFSEEPVAPTAVPIEAPILEPVAEPAVAPLPSPPATLEAATPVEPARESVSKPCFNDSVKAAEGSEQKDHPSLKWVALLLLIGFGAGFFFGVGRALGPANMAFILIGFAGGWLFNRCIKIG